jgi:hypothetical protein
VVVSDMGPTGALPLPGIGGRHRVGSPGKHSPSKCGGSGGRIMGTGAGATGAAREGASNDRTCPSADVENRRIRTVTSLVI